MKNELNEQLSALMDGEILAEEIETVLQAFKTEDSIRTQWANYHLVHDSLKGHLPANFLHNLADQVSRALENEPPLSVEPRSVIDATQRLRHRWKYATSLALAASLSAITVLGIQTLISESVMPESQLSATPPSPPVSPNSKVVPVVENGSHQWSLLEPEVEKRLNSYLVNHTEYVDMPGMIRYGRIVSYENPR